MTYTFQPRGVCSRAMSVEVDDQGVIRDLQVVGGCNGNLQAISRVVEGMTVEQIEGYFKGISCNGRGTSCSDQLATAVRKAKESESTERTDTLWYRFFLRFMGWIDAAKQ